MFCTLQLVLLGILYTATDSAGLEKNTPPACSAEIAWFNISHFLLALPQIVLLGWKKCPPSFPLQRYSGMISVLFGMAHWLVILLGLLSTIMVLLDLLFVLSDYYMQV